MKKIKDFTTKILGFLSVMLFGALVCTVTWQVFARFILKNPSGITEELAKIIFVWLVLVTSAYLFGERGGHMNIGVIAEKVPQRVGAVLNILSEIAIGIFAAFVLVNGGVSAVVNGLKQANAALPFISTGQIYMALPICGIFTIFYSICLLVEDIKLLISGKGEGK